MVVIQPLSTRLIKPNSILKIKAFLLLLGLKQNVWTIAEAAVFGQEMENARGTLHI